MCRWLLGTVMTMASAMDVVSGQGFALLITKIHVYAGLVVALMPQVEIAILRRGNNDPIYPPGYGE